jgi:DNA-binding HxlR family transcriptional regulator
VLWELRDGDALTFRALQARCGGVSSSVLNNRLHELREAAIVTASPDGGYVLTAEGMDLLRSLEPVSAWAKRWSRR